jgi:hypothetical protein
MARCCCWGSHTISTDIVRCHAQALHSRYTYVQAAPLQSAVSTLGHGLEWSWNAVLLAWGLLLGMRQMDHGRHTLGSSVLTAITCRHHTTCIPRFQCQLDCPQLLVLLQHGELMIGRIWAEVHAKSACPSHHCVSMRDERLEWPQQPARSGASHHCGYVRPLL